jgi:hypothetical protein
VSFDLPFPLRARTASDYATRYFCKAATGVLTHLAVASHPAISIMMDESRVVAKQVLQINLAVGDVLMAAPIQFLSDLSTSDDVEPPMKAAKLEELRSLHSFVLHAGTPVSAATKKAVKNAKLTAVTAARSLYSAVTHSLDELFGFSFGLALPLHSFRAVKADEERRELLTDDGIKRHFLYNTRDGSGTLLFLRGRLKRCI